MRAVAPWLAAFERANPDSRVELIPIDRQTYAEKLLAMIRSGRPPDAARIATQDMPRLAPLDMLEELGAVLTQDQMGEFEAARLALCEDGTRLLGLPHTSDVLIVFCNHDAFRRAGLQTPATLHDAWTLDEFSAAAQRLQRHGGVAYGWATSHSRFTLTPFLYMSGGGFVTDDRPVAVAEAPAAREALAWFAEQRRNGFALGVSRPDRTGEAERQFIAGRCGMLVQGSRSAAALAQRIRGFTWTATFLPRGARSATNVAGENLVVLRTPRSAMAVRLVQHLTSIDAMRAFCAETMAVPTRQTLLRGGVPYAIRADVMQVAAAQSHTFRADWAREQMSPAFAAAASQFEAMMDATVGDTARPQPAADPRSP